MVDETGRHFIGDWVDKLGITVQSEPISEQENIPETIEVEQLIVEPPIELFKEEVIDEEYNQQLVALNSPFDLSNPIQYEQFIHEVEVKTEEEIVQLKVEDESDMPVDVERVEDRLSESAIFRPERSEINKSIPMPKNLEEALNIIFPGVRHNFEGNPHIIRKSKGSSLIGKIKTPAIKREKNNISNSVRVRR